MDGEEGEGGVSWLVGSVGGEAFGEDCAAGYCCGEVGCVEGVGGGVARVSLLGWSGAWRVRVVVKASATRSVAAIGMCTFGGIM